MYSKSKMFDPTSTLRYPSYPRISSEDIVKQQRQGAMNRLKQIALCEDRDSGASITSLLSARQWRTTPLQYEKASCERPRPSCGRS
ncbi:hypothetical protein ARMGADRAFT_55757 [Armillaria gallica]|uniref:Uncharacterized protein n=1 Tax=Armillaria gallica TaxID=47427 RepID=A0A2H3F1S0_ARMGA|nr:hypothetical protein ARMGADRAFT_55757 [Armillaria gallica]